MTGDHRVDAIASFPGHAWAWSARLPLSVIHGRQHAQRLTIYGDRVELHRGRHQVVVVDLAELGTFEFEPAVLPRWLHGAELRVRYDDGTYAPAVMVPVAPRALESWLRDQGWPVTTLDSPPPGREVRAVPPNEDGRAEPGSVYRPPGTSTIAAVLWTLLVAVVVASFVGAWVYGVSRDVGSRPRESGSARPGPELALSSAPGVGELGTRCATTGMFIRSRQGVDVAPDGQRWPAPAALAVSRDMGGDADT